jgi:hypothetical protein
MAIFKFHLKPVVSVDAKILQMGANRLKNYFDRVCKKIPQQFSGSSFTVNPNAGDIGPSDLLVYIVKDSLIREIDPNASFNGDPGGATALLAGGAVLSEVYWSLVTQRVGYVDEAHPKDLRQGISIANLAIHEFAHNKHTGTNVNVHVDCGLGILAANQSIGAIAGGDLNDENIEALAKVLGRSVPQYTAAL